MKAMSLCGAVAISVVALLWGATGGAHAATQGGLQFDGVDDYVTFGPASGLGCTTFTLETWFKRTGTGATASTGTGGVTAVPLVTKGRGENDGSNVDMNYFLGIRTTDNVLVADFEEGVAGTTPGLNHPVAGATPIVMNTWYHAAVTYDGTRWQLFLNGVLETELTVGQPPRADSIQHASLGSALTSTGTPAGYFAGILDDVRIWNYARTDTEISENKDISIVAAAGLVGSWMLEEISGITAADSSGSDIHGTLINGPVWVDAPAPPPPLSLVATGAVWKFLDNGTDQGSAWTAPTFDDSAWLSGPAQLGYGDGDEATRVSYGPSSNKKYITTYFRHTFTVADAAAFTNLTLRLLRDDGAVAYLNGVEAARQNMPAGTVNYTTLASSAVGGTDETTFFQSSLNPALLVEGNNVLAVELHQSSANSTDLGLDLELIGIKQTMTITLNAPGNGAVDVIRPPTLSATVTHRSGTPMTAVIYGRVAPPPGGPDFTLAALPDTQYYTAGLNGGTPAMFQAQTDWIVANRVARNIVFTAQFGDCSNDGDSSPTQWLNATNALYRLEDPLTTLLAEGMAYGVAVGNHDQYPKGDPLGTTTYYNEYFGAGHFSGRSYYGGHHGDNNDNSYALFSASGLDFIVLFMEYDLAPDQAVLDWANGLLQTHSTRRGIVVCHSILNVASPATFTSQGQAIYTALKANPNFFLMLCGHNSGEARREDVFNNNKVYSLLADYQDRANGGSGWMRLLEFSPNQNVIRIRTLNPYSGSWETDADSQFDLPYNMEVGAEPFAVLGTYENVASGSTVSHTWSGLSPSTSYEWYVSVNDGTETTTSTRRRFTTDANLLPVVNLTAPDPGSSYTAPASITVTAEPSDADGVITKVEFFAGAAELGETTSEPYEVTWNNVAAGSYALTAVAYDNEGGTTTSVAINVIVNEPDNIPPVVSITSPLNGATFDSPATVSIEATASDSDGTVTYVEFFAGATKLGEDAVAPYGYTWNSAEVGTHTLTAVAHDDRGASTISGGVAITVRPPPAVVRGPYLQLGTPSSMVVRWRTDLAAGSRVHYGLAPDALYTELTDPALTTEHAVALTGLEPGTRYYYEIGTTTGWFTRTGNEFFVTAPVTGTAQPTRIWVLGDSGAANANAAAVRDGFLSYASSKPADLWLMLGDNAFLNGTDAEYQASVFNLYPSILPNAVLWPALGEIDTAGSETPPADLPYFNIFNLPANAEAGGVVSGTEKYYSFNRANVHFICLDSMSSDRSDPGAMVTWLQSDLAANTLPWKIAYWHHPPYSKGNHDSDNQSEPGMQQMRANVLPILENSGVDLVVSGHSRSYERSFMISGHYGNSDTFLQTMKRDGGNGREDGTGAYQKPPGVLGTVYIVAGSSSETAGGALNHPAMLVSENALGSVVLDVNDDRMDVAFVGAGGTTLDYFTILKPNAPVVPPNAPSGLTASTVSGTEIDLTWTDRAGDEVGFVIERSIGGQTYSVVATLGANLTEFRDSGLTPDTAYFYRVKAYSYDSAGEPQYSDYSNEDSASTLLPPPAPTGLTAAAGDSQVTLTWNAVPGTSVSYDVRRSTVHGGPYDTVQYGVGETYYVDSGVINGNTYYYVVRANNGAGPGPDSAEASATPTFPPPTAPSELEVTLVSESFVELRWRDNSSDESGFKMERSLDGTHYELVGVVDPDINYFNDEALAPCTLYFYRVRAYNVWGDSGPAEIAQSTLDETPPVITLIGANPLVVECHGSFVDPGATASDACAGASTVSVSGAVDANTPGTYVLTYSAADPAGNSNRVTRTVTVLDTTPPSVICPAGTSVSADADCQAAVPNVLSGVTASDACDPTPTLSQSPAAGTPVGLGVTTITVTAKDAAGNSSSCATTFAVSDTTPPVVTLNDEATLTVERGTSFADPGATANDVCAGTLTVTVSGSVDANMVGTYTLTYNATDPSGNTGTATRTVNVIDTTPPILGEVAATDLTATTARITWTTDEPADSKVEYGLDLNYGTRVTDVTLVTSHAFNLANLTPNTTYYYRVTSQDASGNAVSSEGHTFTTASDTSYDAYASQDPVLTYGTLGGAGVSATFTIDGTMQTITEAGASARLQAEYLLHTLASAAQITSLTVHLEATWTTLEAGDSLVVAVWNGTAWLDITTDIQDGAFTPAADPQNYVDTEGNIRVRFTDSLAKKGEKKDTLSIDLLYAQVVAGPPDTQPPAAPTGPNAAAADLNVTLTWNANVEPDLAGYRVYRSTGDAYQLITSQLLTVSSYVDSTPAAGTYYYVVTAVDRSGNESDDSTTVSAATSGTTPTIHVEAIDMSISKVAKKWRATATILLHDNLETAQVGAVVTGDWYFNGTPIQTGATGTTDATGAARIVSPTWTAVTGNTFTFVVTTVTLTGKDYSPTQNVETQDSIAVP